MSDVWMPVVFAAVVVLGAVGGQLAYTVLKKLLPLLETMVRERQQGITPSQVAELREEVADLRAEIARLEADDRRIDSLEEQVSFLQSLLEEGGARDELHTGGQ